MAFTSLASEAHVYLHRLQRNQRGGNPSSVNNLDDLLDASDESLFTSTRYNLHQLLPPAKQISYSLRSRGHGLTLSSVPSEFMRKNFMYRMLYNINVKTCVIFFADIVVYIVCLLC